MINKLKNHQTLPERKALRSERKYPKQVRKQLIDFAYENKNTNETLKIFGTHVIAMSKTDLDADIMLNEKMIICKTDN